MPRVRRRELTARRGWTDAHLMHAVWGHDFFGDGFGKGDAGREALREAWADEDFRTRVYERLRERFEMERCSEVMPAANAIREAYPVPREHAEWLRWAVPERKRREGERAGARAVLAGAANDEVDPDD
ncbi:MAG: hypothetical protein AMXMBFR7_26780 [Planctomycetota bacterium]